jgi:hypothetical protein
MDIEIVLIYPFSVSAYNNGIHGLLIMLIFFLLLTIGFIFELGKNALRIDSKQTYLSSDKFRPDVFAFFTLELPYPLMNNNDKPITWELAARARDCLYLNYKGFTPMSFMTDLMELRNRGVKIYTCNGEIYGISNCNIVLSRNEDGSESVSCNFCRLSTPRDLYKGPL